MRATSISKPLFHFAQFVAGTILITFFINCGGNSASNVNSPNSRTLQSVRFSLANDVVITGSTLELKLEAIYSDGLTEDISSKSSYSVDNPNAATITTQTLTALAAGRVQLTAQYFDKQITQTINIFPSNTTQETNCVAQGFTRSVFMVDGRQRQVLWKGPTGPWTYGAILVLHGGGGKASDFCNPGVAQIQDQVQFTTLATQQGFAVFILDSTNNVVVDKNGYSCGKRFDFSVLNRANVDLGYINYVATQLAPSLRPPSSQSAIFITGLSTGGYMTVRAATHFDNVFKAFAPVSAGDPYGTDPDCDPNLPAHGANGILMDRETLSEIGQDNSCVSGSYPNESAWETTSPSVKPQFIQINHVYDGVVDISCGNKLNTILGQKGYTGTLVSATGGGPPKNDTLHYWFAVYNQVILNFFKSTF